jgi:hypothetical protein
MKKAAAFSLLFVISLPVVAAPQTKESVRAEMIQLRKRTGLSLTSFGWGFNVVLFDKRRVANPFALHRNSALRL